MATANASVDNEFNSILFEKKLTNLKDSQESINTCCHWCLDQRQHHKKIVSAWLNVLKRVKVEHRLTLFYLANDVIQYSKRRNYEFVESWGTTLQKATTMVRDEKVKHKILRIFKIWEQRGVYGEEFITDLSGLISASPSARKTDEPHEFQSSYLITKIRGCAKLEADTDLKLKKYKEHIPQIMDGDTMCSSLKDRAHLDDVEKEMDEHVINMEAYVNALKLEIKARNNLISLLSQAELQLDNDKKDVKLVANAYKTFASRVKTLKKKLEEIKPTLCSPVPSPDINAPSPSPDSDIDLPSIETTSTPTSMTTTELTQSIYTNAGFYNPVPPPMTESNSSFLNNNGFTSFMGTNMPFNIQTINATLFGDSPTPTTTQNNVEQTQTTNVHTSSGSISSLFPSTAQPPPPPVPVPPVVGTPTTDYQYAPVQIPLMPPPIPPFSKSSETSYINPPTYNNSYNTNSTTSYGNSSYEQSSNPYPPNPIYSPPVTTYQPPNTTYSLQQPTSYPPPGTNYETGPYDGPISSTFQDTSFPPPPPVVTNFTPAEEYNPEEEPETWEPETNWDQPPVDLETPESPPMFEKEGYCDPIEYHDNQSMGSGVDIDHRVLTLVPPKANSDNDIMHRKKDVDHRNLISLTGSPKNHNCSNMPWKSRTDQDYRPAQKLKSDSDRDYRVPPFSFENLKLPPPPPPPNQQNLTSMKMKKQSPRKGDNIESIDMDMSDEDVTDSSSNTQETVNDNLTVVPIIDDLNKDASDLEPPPPFPEFTDDADANANSLLDDLNDDLDDSDDLISAFMDDKDILVDLMNPNPPSPLFHEDYGPPSFNSRQSTNQPLIEHHNNRPPPFNAHLQNVPFSLMHNGPLGIQRNMLPPSIALSDSCPPIMGSNWMDSNFNPEFPFHSRGNKRGNFSIRGDFRGRLRGAPWRGRVNFRANGNNRGNGNIMQWGNNITNNNNNRGHVITRGNIRGSMGSMMQVGRIRDRGMGRGARPPFFRSRYRGGC